MALPIRIARAIVGVAPETTAGTLVEPTGAQCFHAENITINPQSQFYEQKPTRAHMGPIDMVPTTAEYDISFEVIFTGGVTAGAAAAGVAPYWDLVMMACGHARTTVAATSITYKPTTRFDGATVSTTLYPSEGYSVVVWDEGPGGGTTGVRYASVGCQGDPSWGAKQGEGLRLKFAFKGAFATTIDDATIPAVTDTPLLPPTLLGAALTVHGNATLEFDGFEFSKGNTLSKRADIGAASGLRGFWITAHKPTVKVSPMMILVASFDFYAKWRAGTAGNFQSAVVGGTAGNRYQFVAGRTQFSDIGHGEREGGRTIEANMNISTVYNAVDGDDYSLAIT